MPCTRSTCTRSCSGKRSPICLASSASKYDPSAKVRAAGGGFPRPANHQTPRERRATTGADKVTDTWAVAHTCVRATTMWRHVLLTLASNKSLCQEARRRQTPVSVTPRVLFMSVSMALRTRHGMQMCTLWRGGSSFLACEKERLV